MGDTAVQTGDYEGPPGGLADVDTDPVCGLHVIGSYHSLPGRGPAVLVKVILGLQ